MCTLTLTEVGRGDLTFSCFEFRKEQNDEDESSIGEAENERGGLHGVPDALCVAQAHRDDWSDRVRWYLD